MRRWIIFGLVILVAGVAAANLGSPGAWASDSHAFGGTVPTAHPSRPTRLCRRLHRRPSRRRREKTGPILRHLHRPIRL